VSLWLWVGLGGALGACGRFAVSQWLPLSVAGEAAFPWPTFVVNAIGACLIGALVGAFGQSDWFVGAGRAALVTGVLGGFTTFSAFSLETVQLAQAGHAPLALGYAALSVLVCVLGCWAGLAITQS